MSSYTVILSPNPAGAWAAYCPALPGAAAQGESREAVLREIALVMAAWLELSADDRNLEPHEHPGVVVKALGEILADRAAEGWPLTVETVLVTPTAAIAA